MNPLNSPRFLLAIAKLYSPLMAHLPSRILSQQFGLAGVLGVAEEGVLVEAHQPLEGLAAQEAALENQF